MKVMVYPTSKNALNISHPTDGKLRESGSEWMNDGFTARMLTDGAVTLNKSDGYSSSPVVDTAAQSMADAYRFDDEPEEDIAHESEHYSS